MKRQELKGSKEASQNLILESKNEHTRKINFKTNGITLIALVITIVILIILATVTINFVFGENGLIARAEQSAEMSEVTSILEAMELAKAEAAVDGKGTVDPDDFFDILERDEIIEDKDTDVVDNGDGTYDVTTKGDHEFEVTITPGGDIEIEYQGKGEGPRIGNINVEKTTNSVTIEVETRNAEDATYTYSYKKNGEEEWQEIETSKNNTCTINGLEQNEIYNIKVKVETDKGSVEKEVNVQLGEMPKGTITFDDYVWQGDGTANIIVNTTETGYTMQYQIVSASGTIEDGNWNEVKSGETITGLKYGDTVYARLWDGKNESDYANATIEDEVEPQVEVSKTGENASNSIGVSVKATDGESGMASSVTYTYYIKQSTEADTAYVAKASNVTENTYTFTGLTQGTSYDIKVEVTGDVAGNTGTGYLKGQTTGSIPGGNAGVEQGAITFGTTSWSNKVASITVSTNTSYSIEYQVNGIAEGSWTSIANNGSITGLKDGDEVYARLTDGTNKGDYANATIEDKTVPQGTTISLSGTSTDTEGSVTATVTLKDKESGVNVTGSKWVINSSSGKIGTEEASYTNSFTAEQEKITIKNTTAGTYYLHVLTKDNAGNKSETVSQAVTIKEAKKDIAGAKEDGTKFDDNTELEDDEGNKVTVPGGFEIADDSGTSVEDGIVIQDGRGNQFVWIPTGTYKTSSGSKTNNLSRRSFTSSGSTQVSGDNVIDSYCRGEGYSSSVASGTIGKFKSSASTYGGFYIGRYEQGQGNVIKKNVSPYVSITRDDSMTQAEAIDNGSSFVTSELISSYAWDTALNFICQNNTYTLATTTSSSYANLETDQMYNTGMYSKDNYCNIHDLLGNVAEWTTEWSDWTQIMSSPCVLRGGDASTTIRFLSSVGYAAIRDSYIVGYNDGYLGFRTQLYIK